MSDSMRNKDSTFSYHVFGEQMHRSEGANWKKSGTHENADRFVRYPPAKCSLCKVAASPGSAVVMSLKAFLSFLKFPLAAVVQFFLLGDLNYNISI